MLHENSVKGFAKPDLLRKASAVLEGITRLHFVTQKPL